MNCGIMADFVRSGGKEILPSPLGTNTDCIKQGIV
jgi:hypothetical protein